MPMNNLLKFSDNYSVTPESLQNYYRDEVDEGENENDNANKRICNRKQQVNLLNIRQNQQGKRQMIIIYQTKKLLLH